MLGVGMEFLRMGKNVMITIKTLLMAALPLVLLKTLLFVAMRLDLHVSLFVGME